jgi:CTP synthase (UTP-ammonia lyase)
MLLLHVLVGYKCCRLRQQTSHVALFSSCMPCRIAIYCSLCAASQATHVLTVHDVSNIYHVPLKLVEQNLHNIFREQLKLEMGEPDMREWTKLAQTVRHQW